MTYGHLLHLNENLVQITRQSCRFEDHLGKLYLKQQQTMDFLCLKMTDLQLS